MLFEAVDSLKLLAVWLDDAGGAKGRGEQICSVEERGNHPELEALGVSWLTAVT